MHETSGSPVSDQVTMSRDVLQAAAAVCAMLGLIHIGFTRANYDRLSSDAVWFAAAGFALLFLAALNWAALVRHHPNRLVGRIAILSDGVATLGGIAASYAVREPQAYVLVITFASMGIAGAIESRRLDSFPGGH